MLPPCGAVALVGLVGIVRGWMVRIEIYPEELVLVNWVRTLRLAWTDVARVGCDDEGLWVRRSDGWQTHVSAFQHGHRALGFARKPAQSAAVRLEGIRKRRARG